MPLVKWQIVLTHTIPQTEIPALLEFGYEHIISQNVFFHQNLFSLYFHKNLTCWIVVFWGSVKVFSVSSENVYRWVATVCCFMSDMQNLCIRNRFLKDKHATDLYLRLSVYFVPKFGHLSCARKFLLTDIYVRPTMRKFQLLLLCWFVPAGTKHMQMQTALSF